MKIEIENGKLQQSIDYLFTLKLSRKQSRARRHLIDQLKERKKRVDADRMELINEYSKKDSEGNPVVENNIYIMKDQEAFNEAINELNEEKMVIEGGDHREMIRTVKRVLKKLIDDEVEYEGVRSETFDYLCDQFKADEDEMGDDE
ncbi:hypothetical protein JOD43_002108 [Pullulanibacillus pueri]|uniref:DUF1617 family protein n=1 Tax=Pullulanibacillus pueri TaxID=1437324 RepID=A0A8J3EM30_9BACL|nr:DUF1617 family protein [Pullulanibacillus pueri]MBM7681936.1 hypothetical protein [Pullulanibacillus pueri]GGH83512.1 hypothetical protein GCM10007096_24490 [Pullulanibacillus pueri]